MRNGEQFGIKYKEHINAFRNAGRSGALSLERLLPPCDPRRFERSPLLAGAAFMCGDNKHPRHCT
jgi:hypothetical protein